MWKLFRERCHKWKRKRVMCKHGQAENAPSWLNRTYALIYDDLGNRYLADGEIDRAIAHFSRAIRLDRACSRAYVDRGLCRLKRGEDEIAIRDLSVAIQLDANMAEAYRLRGLLRLSRGDTDLALSDLSRASCP